MKKKKLKNRKESVPANIEVSLKDMTNQLAKLQQELMDLRFEYANARSLAKPARVRQIRSSIARLHTEMEELQQANQPDPPLRTKKMAAQPAMR